MKSECSADCCQRWNNKIGNREYYMNCGKLELTGDGGDQANYDALPDLLVANLAINSCKVPESQNLGYANPGDNPEVNDPDAVILDASECSGPFSGAAGGGGGGGSADSGSGSGDDSGDDSADPAPAPSEPADSEPSASIPGGVFQTNAPEAPAPSAADPAPPQATSSSAVAAPSQSAAPDAGAGAGAGAGDGSGSGAGAGGDAGSAAGALTGACDTEGQFNCIDGTQYQQCASGQWSISMPVADGTQCTPGLSDNMNLASSRRRSLRRFRA